MGTALKKQLFKERVWWPAYEKEALSLSRQDSAPVLQCSSVYQTVFAWLTPNCVSHYKDKPSVCCLLYALDQVHRCVLCWRWMGIMCFRVLQLPVISGFPTPECSASEITKVMTGILISVPWWFECLFDLGKSTRVLNFSIQLWNSVLTFSVEVGSVRHTAVYMWTSKHLHPEDLFSLGQMKPVES